MKNTLFDQPLSFSTVLVISFLIISATPSGSFAQASSGAVGTVSTAGLVALWKFDEGSGATTTDSIGGATGTLLNNPTWTSGKFSKALNFNGTNTYVKAQAPGISNLNTVTASAWIYARSDGNNSAKVRRLVSKSTFNATTGAQVRFALQLGANGTLQFNAGYVGRAGVWSSASNAVSLNQWHQVTATYTFGNANASPALYVDGVAQQVSVVTAPIIGSTPTPDDQMIYIGDRGDNTRVWDGLIDQLRIYNRILSGSEIQSVYQSDTSSVPVPPTLTFTQSATTTTSDGVTGQQFTISWSSTNATSCVIQKSKPDGTIVNPWATGISGTQAAGAAPLGIHHWWIDCTGLGGTAHADLYHTVVSSVFTRPNIVVIMTDDQDDTGSLDFMPQVRQVLINQGLRFTNSFADFSLCCPSRATFLTGQSAHNHGILDIKPPLGGYGNFIPQEGNTLPVWLQSSGYHTAVIGKYLNGYGRDSSETHVPAGWNSYEIFEQVPALLYWGYRMNENGIIKTYGSTDADYQTDVLTQKALTYINSRQNSQQPFFLWLNPHAPHNDGGVGPSGTVIPDSPQPATKYKGAFANQSLPMPPNFNEGDVSDKPGHVQERSLFSTSSIARITTNYRGRLEANLSVDDMVAKVVAELQKTGKLDNTYIIYTSDNGWADGQHRLLYGKNEVYDEIMRVPLIIRGPGVPQAQTRSQLVTNVDLPATIVDLARITPGHTPDGASLTPLFSNPSVPWRTAFFVQGKDIAASDPNSAGTFAAVRTKNYLYAEHTSPKFGLEKEFYNLMNDPYELNSRPNDPAYALTVNSLRTMLSTLKNCIGTGCWVTVPDTFSQTQSAVSTETTGTGKIYSNLTVSTEATVDPENGSFGVQTQNSNQINNPTVSNPTGSCPIITRTLRRGSRGADVRALQVYLISQGLLPDDSATSYFGLLTKGAVQEWQASHGIISSGSTAATGWGLVGLKTRAALANCN